MKLGLPLLFLTASLTSGCVFVPSVGVGGSSGGGRAGGDTVVLCHKGKQTMELPREAAQGHMGHGDTYGSC
jgi:hypothetical protein